MDFVEDMWQQFMFEYSRSTLFLCREKPAVTNYKLSQEVHLQYLDLQNALHYHLVYFAPNN
jgi:hypothetical protein